MVYRTYYDREFKVYGSTDSPSLVGPFILNLILTFTIYSFPILIYRYVVECQPVDKQKAKKITIIYGIISWFIMTMILLADGGGAADGTIVLYCFINYWMLTSGANKENSSDAQHDPNYIPPWQSEPLSPSEPSPIKMNDDLSDAEKEAANALAHVWGVSDLHLKNIGIEPTTENTAVMFTGMYCCVFSLLGEQSVELFHSSFLALCRNHGERINRRTNYDLIDKYIYPGCADLMNDIFERDLNPHSSEKDLSIVYRITRNYMDSRATNIPFSDHADFLKSFLLLSRRFNSFITETGHSAPDEFNCTEWQNNNDRHFRIIARTWKAAVTHINNIGLPKDTHCLICIYSATYYFIQPFLKVSFDEYHQLFVQVADISFNGTRSSKTLDDLFHSQFPLLDLYNHIGLQPRDNQNDFKKMYRLARSCAEEMPNPPPFFPLYEELDFLQECSNVVEYIDTLS